MLIKTLADPLSLPREIIERKDLTKKISKAIKKLPLDYRRVLSLYYNNHFNFREIAEILKEPIDTIKSRHRRALVLLKKLIEF